RSEHGSAQHPDAIPLQLVLRIRPGTDTFLRRDRSAGGTLPPADRSRAEPDPRSTQSCQPSQRSPSIRKRIALSPNAFRLDLFSAVALFPDRNQTGDPIVKKETLGRRHSAVSFQPLRPNAPTHSVVSPHTWRVPPNAAPR